MAGSVSNTHRNVSYALALHTQDLSDLQEKVATGSKVNRVSDGPSIAFHLLSLESIRWKQSSRAWRCIQEVYRRATRHIIQHDFCCSILLPP